MFRKISFVKIAVAISPLFLQLLKHNEDNKLVISKYFRLHICIHIIIQYCLIQQFFLQQLYEIIHRIASKGSLTVVVETQKVIEFLHRNISNKSIMMNQFTVNSNLVNSDLCSLKLHAMLQAMGSKMGSQTSCLQVPIAAETS